MILRAEYEDKIQPGSYQTIVSCFTAMSGGGALGVMLVETSSSSLRVLASSSKVLINNWMSDIVLF